MGTVTALRREPEMTTGIMVRSFRDHHVPGLAKGSQRLYLRVLDEFAEAFGSRDLDPDEVATWFSARYGDRSASRWNTARSVLRSMAQWWAKQGWETGDPFSRISYRKDPAATDRALPESRVQEILGRRDLPLRERTLWTLLYESAARANEVLSLNIEDLDLGNHRARITGKGGAAETITWGQQSAIRLSRYLKGRTSGPVFLTERPANVPKHARDLSPDGRARLSYDRAREIFTTMTGHDLHQWRHSRLTHMAEAGINGPLLMAKSRHRNIGTLARYARPGIDALQRAEAEMERQ